MTKSLPFMIVALAAAWFLFGKGTQPLHVAGSASRFPASIQKVFDFSYLEGAALETAAKQRLLNSIEITTNSDKTEVAINLGNFVLLEGAQKNFACGFYDRVILTFEAEGVGVNGEKPRLEVETGCAVGSNINNLKPIHLPLARLKSRQPTDDELKFLDLEEPMTIRLSHIPPEWPRSWVLREIQMNHSKFSSRIIKINPQEASSNRQLSMKW